MFYVQFNIPLVYPYMIQFYWPCSCLQHTGYIWYHCDITFECHLIHLCSTCKVQFIIPLIYYLIYIPSIYLWYTIHLTLKIALVCLDNTFNTYAFNTPANLPVHVSLEYHYKHIMRIHWIYLTYTSYIPATNLQDLLIFLFKYCW